MRLAATLEHVLAGQLKTHRDLRACLGTKGEAVRTANAEAITSACVQERALMAVLEDLERKRAELVRRMAPLAAAPAPGSANPAALPAGMKGLAGGAAPVRMSAIISAIGGDAGERLRAITYDLRAVVIEVKRESAVLRAAADALARHVGGILETAHGAMNRAKVYGRRGRIDTNIASSACIDVKS